jgi:hypothetical protein
MRRAGPTLRRLSRRARHGPLRRNRIPDATSRRVRLNDRATECCEVRTRRRRGRGYIVLSWRIGHDGLRPLSHSGPGRNENGECERDEMCANIGVLQSCYTPRLPKRGTSVDEINKAMPELPSHGFCAKKRTRSLRRRGARGSLTGSRAPSPLSNLAPGARWPACAATDGIAVCLPVSTSLRPWRRTLRLPSACEN